MRIRISLFRVLLTVSILCVLFAGIRLAFDKLHAGTKASRTEHFASMMAEVKSIENLRVFGYEEEFQQFTVTKLGFSIGGIPDSSVELFIADGEEDLGALRIVRIGDVCPVMLEWQENSKSWAPRHPSLGNVPNYRPAALPWGEMRLADLVKQYEDIDAYFSEWPEYPESFELLSSDGRRFRCYRMDWGARTESYMSPPYEDSFHVKGH